MQKIKEFTVHLVLSVIGLVAMNAALTFVVNPFLGRELGTDGQGRVLFFTSLATLLAGALGSGANYGRMKIYADERSTENGEYNIFLLMMCAVISIVCIAAILIKGDSAGASWFGIIFLVCATSIRFYADVEFRLKLNYKRFSLFYIIIGAGYMLGFFLYRFTHSWVMIYVLGELSGLLFVILTGTIFRPPFFRVTKRFGKHMGTLWALSGSYLLSDFVGAVDRMLLPILLTNGDELTSLYYYASLVGKMMSLLSTPLNGVVAGYLAKNEKGITRKLFLRLVMLMLLVWAAVTAVSVAGSHLYVYLFYRSSYELVKPLFLLANAGQVVFFICNTMMVVVLRYTNDKIQSIISIIYIVVFFAVSIPLIRNFGLFGMAWGIFIANTMKFILYAVLGFFGIREAK